VKRTSRQVSHASAAETAAGRRLIHDADGLNTAIWPAAADRLVTPVDHFFTRSHAAVPQIDPTAWRLEVGGLVDRPRSFSLEELGRDFPQKQVTATLVCAGLRRNEFLALGPLPGELPWGPEPASTGQWTGVALRDVLQAAGVAERARYVEFIGLDQVERHGDRFGFGGSIELSKALSDEVILASELNGAPLPAVHGFPLRALVPGWIGARSVKWLGRISLLQEPSPNYFQSKAYRDQREIDPQNPRDVSGGAALSVIPVNSVILYPTPEHETPAGRVQVRGWAVGSGGCPLVTVELSPNGGRDWIRAQISTQGTGWAWSLWEATVDLPRGRHTLVARARDSAGLSQPPDVQSTWNVKGYNNNAWHRATIDLV
jgi:sulfite oxidase